MKLTKYLSLAPALAILAASSLAQEGSPVSGQSRPQAQELQRRTFVKASTGATAIVNDEEGQRLGVVRDHVIDLRSGRVLQVAVAVDDKGNQARLVPYDRFSWSAEGQSLSLRMTADELGAMPVYDPGNLSASDARASGGEGGKSLGAMKQGQKLASSGIRGSEVMARQEGFASVRELVLEPKLGTIAFVLASRPSAKADPLIIPWPAMTWKGAEEEGRGHFALPMAIDALEDAPELEGGDPARLEDGKTLESIYRFYDLTPPLSDVGKAGARG